MIKMKIPETFQGEHIACKTVEIMALNAEVCKEKKKNKKLMHFGKWPEINNKMPNFKNMTRSHEDKSSWIQLVDSE